jgi:hypothetical protein
MPPQRMAFIDTAHEIIARDWKTKIESITKKHLYYGKCPLVQISECPSNKLFVQAINHSRIWLFQLLVTWPESQNEDVMKHIVGFLHDHVMPKDNKKSFEDAITNRVALNLYQRIRSMRLKQIPPHVVDNLEYELLEYGLLSNNK